MPSSAAAPLAFSAADTRDRKRLGAMRTVATTLLLVMAALFVLAESQLGRHPIWGYVAAFSEAAMVGALADWFAVVALFRHPLGVPIWHTAIIPNSKDEIAKNLGEFVETHFVSPSEIVGRVRAFDPAARASRWLSEPRNALQAAQLVSQVLRVLEAKLDDTKLRTAITSFLKERISELYLAPVVAEFAEDLHEGGAHTELFNWSLTQAVEWLDSPDALGTLTEVFGAVDNRMVKMMAGQLAGFAKNRLLALTTDALGNEDHPLRQRYESAVQLGLDRLRNDPEWAARVRHFQFKLIDDARLPRFVDRVWASLKEALIDDLGSTEPRFGLSVSKALADAGTWLAQNDAAKTWINETIVNALLPAIESNRGAVARFIKEQIDDWSKEEMTDRLEVAVGRDLQFIRINGTIVGGLVGLVLYVALQLAHRTI